MDFFEEQSLARKRTARLVFLFVLAVIGVMAAVYLLIMFIWLMLVTYIPALSLWWQ